MTLDEAIKHAQDVAKEKKASIKYYKTYNLEELIPSCEKCAEEHKQLAEWLKELKELKKGAKT